MLDEHVHLALYAVNETSYETLILVDRRLPHWVISHVAQGEVHVSTHGEIRIARAGDVMIHAPHQLFAERASVPGIHEWLIFDATLGTGLALLRRYPTSPVVTLADPGAFRHLFTLLKQAAAHDRTPSNDLRIFAWTLELIGLVLESNAQAIGSLPVQRDNRFEPVLAYMNEHLSSRLTRTDLARIVHLHPSHFDRAFHKEYAISPMGMLREMRLQRAKHLLAETNHPLEAIAEMCGLRTAAYLSRVFRAQYGETPGTYRQRVKSAKTGYILPL